MRFSLFGSRMRLCDAVRRVVRIAWATALFPGVLAAQRSVEAGVGVQVYPAGFIVTGQGTLPLSDGVDLTGFAGINVTDRGDFGEHQNEEGDGVGVGLGGRWFPRAGRSGFFLAARADIWRLTIDWSDPGGTGTTMVTVLQPTAIAGWRWVLGPRLSLDTSAALGAEINVRTRGEAVGEGAIVLGGVTVAWRF